MPYKVKLSVNSASLTMFGVILLFSVGCGNDQSDHFTTNPSGVNTASHGSSIVATHQTPSTNPPQLTPPQIATKSPSQTSPSPPSKKKPTSAGSSTTSSSTNSASPPVTVRKQPSPFNSQRKPLPAYAYEWKKDQDDDYFDYANRCVFPSEVKDPHNTLTYGTMLDELFEVRRLVKRHYIFRDEVVDLDPRKFVEPYTDFDSHFKNMTDEDSYFQQLRTKVKRKDGLPKHGEFRIRKDTVANAFLNKPKIYQFGIIWDKRSENPPRDYVVKFVKADSPGSELRNGEPKIKRGDKLVKVNDIDFVSARSTKSTEDIEKGLEPRNKGVVTKFELIDRDSKQRKTVFLSPTAERDHITESAMMIKTDSGLVGYVNIGDWFLRFDQLYESIKEFKNNEVKDVIIDIRYYNRFEGYFYSSKPEPMLLYTILGKKNTHGKKFRFRRGTTGNKELNTFPPVTPFFSKCESSSEESQKKEFCDASMRTFVSTHALYGPVHKKTFDFDLTSLDLNKVYLLTSDETCHIGERIVNSLLGIDVEVIQIGEQTCGSPYHSHKVFDHCGISYGILDTYYVNDKGEGDYIKGFKPKNTKSEYGVEIPGCFVLDDFSRDLGDEQEAMLAAALQYRKDGTCPTIP